MMIDVNFDFTTDTPGYWENFWKDECGIGGGANDPDASSKTLQSYHSLLWSKQLPNGQYMKLSKGNGYNYLTWDRFRFGSDSILASFRYVKYRRMLDEVRKAIPNYKIFIENFLRSSYTIGGSIIFPKGDSLNRARGCNPLIKDRWDLTLECIRRYYNNEKSPLYDVLLKNKDFFDLFVDFKGYVDFFFLQDCVTSDYNAVIKWIDNDNFMENPLPKSVDDYILWINKQLEFLKKRNKRIENSLIAK